MSLAAATTAYVCCIGHANGQFRVFKVLSNRPSRSKFSVANDAVKGLHTRQSSRMCHHSNKDDITLEWDTPPPASLADCLLGDDFLKVAPVPDNIPIFEMGRAAYRSSSGGRLSVDDDDDPTNNLMDDVDEDTEDDDEVDDEYEEGDDEDAEEDLDDLDDEDEDDLDSYDYDPDNRSMVMRRRQAALVDDDEDILNGDADEDDDVSGMGITSIRSSRGRSRAGRDRLDLNFDGADADEEDELEDFDEPPGDILDLSTLKRRLDDDDGDNDENDDEDDDELGMGEEDSLELERDNGGMTRKDDDELLKEAADVLAGSSLAGLGFERAVRARSSKLPNYTVNAASNTDLSDLDEGDDPELENFPGDVDDGGIDEFDDLSAALDATEDDELPPGLARRKGPRTGTPLDDIDDLAGLDPTASTAVRADLEGLDDFGDGQIDDDLEQSAEPKNLDSYVDRDEDDEEIGFGVTSEGAFGRVWELNEDTYVTITEPGQRYTYEIEESDEEDQDVATMRRGKSAGWGGVGGNLSSADLKEGSREWIARKSYELMTKCSYQEMYMWTRLQGDPPKNIAEMFDSLDSDYVDYSRTSLNRQVVSPQSFRSQRTQSDAMPVEVDEVNEVGKLRGNNSSPEVLDASSLNESTDSELGIDAIQRSLTFPCTYKFKVVGIGEDVPRSLASSIEKITGRKLAESAFKFEPAGRYQRITVDVLVEGAHEFTALYEAIQNNPLVKFSYS